jgi:hypothetical protein
MTGLDWLRGRLRAHNRAAAWLAIVSFVSGIALWGLAYFFFVLILLGLVTAAKGDQGPEIPRWIPETAFGLAVILLVWGMGDHFRNRYTRLTDRPIIGWHLFRDFLLLPVRLTFGSFANLGAIRRLDAGELERAWELLLMIQERGKVSVSTLGLIESDDRRRLRLVSALQLCGIIDLHHVEEDWFYTLRSSEEGNLRKLLTDGTSSRL